MPEARFISGSIIRHILVMTATGALGLMAVFTGDLANLFFLGQLHDTEVLAAVGYGGTVLFFAISIGIGMSIGATAAVAPAIGAGHRADARRLSTSSLLLTTLICGTVSLVAWPFLRPILATLGATGRTLDLAVDYLRIVLPTFPMIAFGMTCGGILRSAGDPRQAMFVTLSGAVVNVILDAVFILALHYGLPGAAWASVLSRLVTVASGVWGVGYVHGLLRMPAREWLASDFARLIAVGLPAVATNLATPVSNAFITKALAGFGDGPIAAWSVYGRINPVAFGAIFALTGSIGPIIGQNLGAQNFARVRATIRDAARTTVVFTAIAWAGLAIAAPQIVSSFGLGSESAPLIYLACRVLPPFFAFLGFLFIANAVFNTLRYGHYATIFNWGRATLGTIPFVMVGGHLAGAPGVFVASMVSGIFFGIGALWVAIWLVGKLEADSAAAPSGDAQ